MSENNNLHNTTKKFLYFIDVKEDNLTKKIINKIFETYLEDHSIWKEFEGDMDIIINDLTNIKKCVQ
jgi:hypothetical protein